MEGLVFLLIIIFVAVNARGNKQKTAQRRAAGLQDRLTAEMVNRANVPPRVARQTRARRVEQPADIPTIPRQTPEPFPEYVVTLPAEGESLHDDEECLGGSMGHSHTEGESAAEHRAHVEALYQRESEEALVAQAALDLAGMNIHHLRQAVVMAEILDKPKALRRRARSGEPLRNVC